MNDITLIFSLISLGFLGGFSHCVGMCAPFVLTQVANRLEKTPLEKFSNFQRLKNFALLPYHLGRITTYSFLGFFCSFFTQNIQDFVGFKIFSAAFLFMASAIFFGMLFEKKIAGFFSNLKLRFKLRFLEGLRSFFQKKISQKISFLFKNPQGFNGYFLGLILGLIPCGLLYAAFMIAAAISQPVLAGIGMLFFGISTFPALFFVALGGNFFLKNSQFKLIVKAIILINAITLFLMAIKLIT